MAREEALAGKVVAEAMAWAAESKKDDVLAYFGPDGDTVARPPETVPVRVLEDERRDKVVGDCWSFTGGAGLNA